MPYWRAARPRPKSSVRRCCTSASSSTSSSGAADRTWLRTSRSSGRLLPKNRAQRRPARPSVRQSCGSREQRSSVILSKEGERGEGSTSTSQISAQRPFGPLSPSLFRVTLLLLARRGRDFRRLVFRHPGLSVDHHGVLPREARRAVETAGVVAAADGL